MATSSLLVRVLILYFGINLMLFAGGVHIQDARVFGTLVNASSSDGGATIVNGSQYGLGSIGGNTPDVNANNGSTILNFIDVLGAVRNLVNALVVILGGVFIVFLTFPSVVQFYIGVPLGLLTLIGLVYFVRSGQ